MVATLDTTRGGGSVEASTGSVVHEATVFWESSIDGGIATGWGNHQPQAGSTADAGVEVAGGVSQAADDAPGTDSRALPLVAAGGSGDASESGVGGGSDLHSDGAGESVFGGGDGLGQSPGVVMAVVEFVGCEQLRVGVAGGSDTPWPTGDLQYRSR